MDLLAHANVLGYTAGEPFTIDDDDEAGLALVEPYIIGGHVTIEDGPPAAITGVIDPPAVVDDLTPEAAAKLRGQALDDALRARGLSTTAGGADDKRASLVAAVTPAE